VLAKQFGAPHLSTGDMLREHIEHGTSLGMQAQPVMSRGELVSDSLVLKMVAERIERPDCTHGFVFDGFSADRGAGAVSGSVAGRARRA